MNPTIVDEIPKEYANVGKKGAIIDIEQHISQLQRLRRMNSLFYSIIIKLISIKLQSVFVIKNFHFLIVGMYAIQTMSKIMPIIEAILSYSKKLFRTPAIKGPLNSPKEMDAENRADEIVVHLSSCPG